MNEHDAKVGLIYCKLTVKKWTKRWTNIVHKKTNDPINRAYSEGLKLMDDSLIKRAYKEALDGKNRPIFKR